jgi:hypothetical protein
MLFRRQTSDDEVGAGHEIRAESRSAGPAGQSETASKSKISLPAPPLRLLAPELPTSALPVPFGLPEPCSSSRSTLAAASGYRGARIHRSHWVAAGQARRILREKNRRMIELVDGRRLPVSRP